MKSYIQKGISLMMVVTMSAWCFTGCGTTSNSSEEAETTKETTSDTTNMEALLTSKVGNAGDTEKQETVYVEMKADGTVSKTTVSNVLKVSGKDSIKDYSTLDNITNLSGEEQFAQDEEGNLIWENQGENISYQGTTTEALPLEIQVTYYLDDKEISAEEIAGKSGKVKIVYDYTNRAKGDKGEFVPFFVMTGMVMDKEHFSNIEAENGRVVDNDDSGIVIGYAVPKLKEHLMQTIDHAEDYIEDMELPESFTVTADATDFSMDMTLTVATSQIGDLDLKETLDLSDIQSQMNKLQEGADELADGAKDLEEGAGELASGSSQIRTGAADLSKYTMQMAEGTGELDNQYTVFNKALLAGVKSVDKGAKQVYSGTKELESAAEAVNSGAKEIESAATSIKNGSKELDSAAGQVDGGAKELESAAGAVNAGGKELKNGISQVKSAFEDTTNADGSVKSQGLNNGAKSLAEGAKSANAGVSEVVKSMQSTPELIQAQIDEIIGNLAAFQIDSAEELETTVKALNSQIANADVPMETFLANTAVKTTDNYYTLLNAYYSVQTLQQVKEELSTQINGSAKSVQALLQGMEELENGSKILSDGIEQVYGGIQSLDEGAKNLVSGTEQMSGGMKSLTQGTTGMKAGTDQLSSGASSMADGTKSLSEGTKALKKGTTTLKNGAKELSSGTGTLNSEIGGASPKIKTAASRINEAAKAISEGAGTLASGATELDEGIITLADGTKELEDGAIQLNDEGISKITEIFGEDAPEAVDVMEDTLNAGKRYKSFSGINDDMSGDVKFIFRTEEISADNE